MSTKELIYDKGILNIYFWCNTSGNQVVMCSESKNFKLNSGHIVIARADWKSGKSSTEKVLATIK